MGLGKWSDYEVNPLVKYFLFFFNFILWIISTAFIAIGVWAYIEKEKFKGSIGATEDGENGINIYDIVFDLSIIVIIVGSVMFVITFCGCIGALRENALLLKLFCIFVGIVFLVEVVLAILAFVFSAELEDQATEILQDEGIPRYRSGDLDWNNFVDWIQETFKCCGVGPEGYLDWNNNQYFNCSQDNRSAARCGVPHSCCIDQNDIDPTLVNTMCGYGIQEEPARAPKVVYTEGCVNTIKNEVESNLYLIGGVVLGLVVPQLICIFLSWCLLTQVKNSRFGA